MANYSSSGCFNGLGTINLGVPSASNYLISCTITLPTIPEGEVANSQVVVTLKINGGSTIFTSNLGDKGFQFKTAAAANDIFNITLTSAAAVDQPKNIIKTFVAISEI